MKTFRKVITKILVGIGAVFLIGLIIAGVVFAKATQDGNQLDYESYVFVNTITPQILLNWDSEKLLSYADEEFLKATTEEDVKQLFNSLASKLGAFKSYKDSRGEARIFYNNFQKEISAYYIADVVFESGPATVNITLVNRNDSWYIYGFFVNSPAFVN